MAECVYVGPALTETRQGDTQEGFFTTKVIYDPPCCQYSPVRYDDIMPAVRLKDVVLHPAHQHHILDKSPI